jgi:quercetin dioxygenase-like cupin family protein
MTMSIRILAREADTDGHLAVIDEVVPAGFGPELHVHETFDEAFYVLDGMLTFQVEDVITAGPAYTWIWIPRGTPHTFANHSGQPARTLVLCTPAGFESHFDRLIARAAGHAERAVRSAAELGTRTVGTTIPERVRHLTR